MKQFNFTEARNNFAFVLDTAKKEGAICIAKRDGEVFYLTPASSKKSPLDIEGVNLGLSSDEIVSYVNEARDRDYAWGGEAGN